MMEVPAPLDSHARLHGWLPSCCNARMPAALPSIMCQSCVTFAGYNLGTVLYAHACALQEALLASQEQAEAAQLAAAASGSGRAPSLGMSSPTAGGRGSGQQLE